MKGFLNPVEVFSLSFFHRLKKMSATFIVVASKHAVGTKLRNSLVDDFLPFSDWHSRPL